MNGNGTQQFPKVVNANQNGGACSTGKKYFSNSALAQTFANEQRISHPHEAAQTPYACESCPGWHLSAMTTDAHSMMASRTDWRSNPTYAVGLNSSLQHRQTEIKEMYATLKAGKGRGHQYYGIIADVCHELKIERSTNGNPSNEYQSVVRWLADLGLYQKLQRGTEATAETIQKFDTQRGYSTLDSLAKQEDIIEDSIDAQIAALNKKKNEQLAEIERKRNLLIEVKSLKVIRGENGSGGVLLKREGNILPLPLGEAFDLIDKLNDLLAGYIREIPVGGNIHVPYFIGARDNDDSHQRCANRVTSIISGNFKSSVFNVTTEDDGVRVTREA